MEYGLLRVRGYGYQTDSDQAYRRGWQDDHSGRGGRRGLLERLQVLNRRTVLLTPTFLLRWKDFLAMSVLK